MADYTITVKANDEAVASRAARALTDVLREAEGVRGVEAGKSDDGTMDIGTVVSVIAASGATVAIARGIADWLRARRGVVILVERVSGSDSLKTHVSGLDPIIAERIVESIL